MDTHNSTRATTKAEMPNSIIWRRVGGGAHFVRLPLISTSFFDIHFLFVASNCFSFRSCFVICSCVRLIHSCLLACFPVCLYCFFVWACYTNLTNMIPDLPGPPGISRDLPGSPGTSRDLPGPAGTSRDLPGPPGTCRDLPGPRGTSRDLPGPINISRPNFPGKWVRESRVLFYGAPGNTGPTPKCSQ